MQFVTFTDLEMGLLQSLWQRIRTIFGSQQLAANSSSPDQPLCLRGELAAAVRLLAEREGKSEEKTAGELLAFALAHRAAAEENLRRWRTLSPREQEVVALVCKKYTNAQIADHLLISTETVKTHIRNAVQKLGLRTRFDLRQALEDWDFSAWAGPRVEEKED